MPELNEQQKKIVYTHNKNLTVSASAGTGKTFSVVNRICDLIINHHISIDRFLVMSFTDLSAKNLKSSLINKLTLQNKEKHDPFIEQQIALIPTSNISTIHAFCLYVIKQYGYVLDIDPQSLGKVANDALQQQYSSLAMTETCSDILQYQDLLSTLSGSIGDLDSLEDTIKRIADIFVTRSNVKEYIDDVEKNYVLLEKGELPKKVEATMLSYIKDKLGIMVDLLRIQIDSFYQESESDSSRWEIYRDNLVNKYLSFDISTINIDTLNHITSNINASNFPRLSGLSESRQKEFKNKKKEFKDYISDIEALISQYNTLRQDSAKVHLYVQQLFSLTQKYQASYQRIKQSNNVIDYNDMEELAYQVLTYNHNLIANQIKDRLYEIIIDEYQDSNQKQEDIIQLLSKGNNVTRVGDVKQSIYGFRNAKPELMLGFINNPLENDELIHLQSNYRCDKNIIDYTNNVFSVLMNVMKENTFRDGDKLIAGKTESNNLPISFYYSLDASDAKAPDKVTAQGRIIARKIKQLMAANPDIKLNSFMILVRKNVHKAIIKKVLDAENLPVYTTSRGTFYNDNAISSVISILQLICNQNNDIALLDVLTGPIYQTTYNQIGQYYLDKDNNSLEQYLISINHPIIALVNETRKIYASQGMVETLTYLLNYQDWVYNFTSINQKTSLNELFTYLIDLDKQMPSLYALNDYIAQDELLLTHDDTLTFSQQDNAISLLTIHQSKGLESDYVFIADSPFNLMSDRKTLKTDDELGLAINPMILPYRIKQPYLYSELILYANYQKSVQEELRLLYVAMTRAKKQLIIVSNIPKQEDEYNPLPGNDNEITNFEMPTAYPISKQQFQGKKTYTAWLEATNKKLGTTITTCEIKGFVSAEDVERKQVKRTTNIMSKYPNTSQPLTYSTASSTHARQIYPLDYANTSADIRGTNLHKAIELLGIKNDSIEKVDSLEILSSNDKALLKDFYQHPLTTKLMDYQTYSELPYVDYVNNTNGIIDLLAQSDNSTYIVDFKSDRFVDRQQLIDRYIDQLVRYYSIINKRYPDLPICTYIYSFELKDYIDLTETIKQILI